MNNDLFRFIRVQKRYSQRKFAEKVGISKGLVSLIETNERPVTRSTAAKVLSALGISDKELEAIAKLQSILKGDETKIE
ncbi:helix-turn-helix domain-containing protein [Heyndrickxia oleronia]|uniref:helix-turn-helix domain-containing protein n=1 Tax=Heyndrickxia oleronia TaxID=38875 RepID=UPI001B2AC976|nr:helix-turn-helix transcriptional regulator [Heyndrickxia oleronia]GIN39615.1 hypothetical protein J19TS1_25640 [Heyndrickxia oleronia]